MCTAISFRTKDHYFGRNLDYEQSYGEQVAITPRKVPFPFRKVPEMKEHYAMIGMAMVVNNYPLYYEATNEKGLSIAGLLFSQNAVYQPEQDNKDNITPFELIPWLLGQCQNISEVREKLVRINLVNIPFSEEYPLSPLHWLMSDRKESITVESVKDGLRIYENPVGVLTNNPPFDMQMFELNRYRALTTEEPRNTFADGLGLDVYSRGMGAMGLPGDLSSTSRFVKATFTKMNSRCGESESESISQFFHILDSVEQQRGCVHMGEGKYEITLYSSCCNTDRGIYYYKSYENSRITAVDMYGENLMGENVITYSLVTGQQVYWQNKRE